MATLKPNQFLAAAYIAQGRPKKDAASIADVTPQTVSEWMKQKSFTDAIEDFKAELIYVTRDRIRGLGTQAARTLGDLMANGTPAVRLAAAKDVLDRINLTPGSAGAEMGLWCPETRKAEATLFPFIEASELALGGSDGDTAD